MAYRALFPLVGCLFLLQLTGLAKADDEAPGRVRVVIPPTSEESPQLVPVPEPADAATSPSEEKKPAQPPIENPMPDDPPTAPEPITVPSPEDGKEVIIEDGGTLKSETEEEDEYRRKPTDFSYTRWWVTRGQTEWIPGHRDRFGMFTWKGETAHVWEDWGNLASIHGLGFHFLNGPVSSDLPSKLFDFSWGLNWIDEIGDGWSASLSGKAGLFTDFEDSVREGWRFPAHAVVFHDWTSTVQGVAGVEYFDRQNLPALPVLGVILKPNERVRLEAVFPEPRIAFRVHAEAKSENWLSFSGEIGGGEWAIERSNTDLADVVTYNDYRIVLGFHGYDLGQLDQAFEIGYLIARDLEYRSGVGDMEPDNTLFFRLSSRY